jgi:prepilin-type N-terminal cleavage/methylation domain-containing protein
MKPRPRKPRPVGSHRAFTLIEVIVALGLLAGGLVAVLGMFVPLAKFGAENEDGRRAARAAVAVNGELRRWPFPAVLAALPSGDAEPGPLFLVSRSGDVLAPVGDPVWQGRETRPFFAVTLRRAGGPMITENAGEPAWMSFLLGVRWPVSDVGAGGHSELSFPGSVRR